MEGARESWKTLVFPKQTGNTKSQDSISRIYPGHSCISCSGLILSQSLFPQQTMASRAESASGTIHVIYQYVQWNKWLRSRDILTGKFESGRGCGHWHRRSAGLQAQLQSIEASSTNPLHQTPFNCPPFADLEACATEILSGVVEIFYYRASSSNYQLRTNDRH